MPKKTLEQLYTELAEATTHHARLKILRQNRDITRFWANKIYQLKKRIEKITKNV